MRDLPPIEVPPGLTPKQAASYRARHERSRASLERARRLIAAIEQTKQAYLAFAVACQEAADTFEAAAIEASIRPQPKEREPDGR